MGNFNKRFGDDSYLVQILNYSGFNGMTFTRPLPLKARLSFPGLQVSKVQVLEQNGRRRISSAADGRFSVNVKVLYQAVLVTAKEREGGNPGINGLFYGGR